MISAASTAPNTMPQGTPITKPIRAVIGVPVKT
jgi:hypothetical protein